MGASGLEEVRCLDVPHEGDVAVEETENEGRVVSGMEECELAETEAGWDVCQWLVRGAEGIVEGTHSQEIKFSSCPEP